jgi:hypothetical protein
MTTSLVVSHCSTRTTIANEHLAEMALPVAVDGYSPDDAICSQIAKTVMDISP